MQISAFKFSSLGYFRFLSCEGKNLPARLSIGPRKLVAMLTERIFIATHKISQAVLANIICFRLFHGDKTAV